MYKSKRPAPIVTDYVETEVRTVFQEQYWRAQDTIAHLRNSRGFVRYRHSKGCDRYNCTNKHLGCGFEENEGHIIRYYEDRNNVAGLSPFDLISERRLEKLNQAQLEWENKYLSWKKNKKVKL
jgi:hypothetical protein